MWYEFLACFLAGFFAGALVMAMCSMAKCADCEAINRIVRGEKS